MRFRVVIVAKTRIRGGACAGGLALDRDRNVRLLGPDGPDCPSDSGYNVGDVWNLEAHVPSDLLPPHVEDIIVYEGQREGQLPHLRETLLQRVQSVEGPPERLFEGLLQPTDTGSGYISLTTGVPQASVGFWLSDEPLQRVREGNTVRYRYPGPYGVRSLSYVGFAPPLEVLPAGTLLRVSLARWWRSPDAPGQDARCYLQLSGWYV